MTIHSPLGASGAARWMACPGSAALVAAMPVVDDGAGPAYRQEGTAAHELVADCLQGGGETFERSGTVFGGLLGSSLDLPALQTYLDFVHEIRRRPTTLNEWIEHRIGENEVMRPHPQFFGTVDYAAISLTELTVVDLKNGEGVSVEARDNPQLMYYAYGIILDLDHGLDYDFPVNLIIYQPRVHGEQPVREWKTTIGYITDWGRDVLIPMMKRANVEKSFAAGEHCRFCPAKIACPLLQGMFKVAATINTSAVKGFQNSALGQEWSLIAPVKMYIKAVEDETLARLMASVPVEGTKLVNKRSNRVWKDGAETQVLEQFGSLAMTEPQLKSPPEIEKIGASGKEMVKEWAFTPQTGYSVASEDDKRPEVKVEKAFDTYAHYVEPS